MRIIRKISILIFFFFYFTNISWSQTASEFISALSDEASDVLSSKLSDEEKILILKKIGEKTVDIEGVGLYTLGKYRKTLTDPQKKQYKELFRNYFLKSFSSRLSQYSDPKINVISQNVINDKYTIVSSVLVETEDRPEIKIDWRVYTKDPNKPLIRDLIIEGLSLARTQKEEFNSVIQGAEGNVNALLKNLEIFNTK